MKTNGSDILSQRDKLSEIAKAHFKCSLSAALGNNGLIIMSERELPEKLKESFVESEGFENGLFEGSVPVSFLAIGTFSR
jgi:hypothetical protein